MMFKRREDLVAEVLRQDKNLTAAQKRFAKQLDKLYRDYTARFEALIRRPQNFDAQDRMNLARGQRIIEQLNALLSDAGMDDLVADYTDHFGTLTKDALKYFALVDESVTLSGVDRTTLTGFIRFSETTLRTIVDARLVQPLAEGIFQATLGGLSRDAIVSDLVARSDSLSIAQAQVVVGDSFAQYQRTVTAEKADSLGLEVYLYQGPDDEITSEQCSFMLNYDEHGLEGAFFKDEISADLHENLRANPLIAGGHPRCRHRWAPIPLDAAIEMGFKP